MSVEIKMKWGQEKGLARVFVGLADHAERLLFIRKWFDQNWELNGKDDEGWMDVFRGDPKLLRGRRANDDNDENNEDNEDAEDDEEDEEEEEGPQASTNRKKNGQSHATAGIMMICPIHRRLYSYPW